MKKTYVLDTNVLINDPQSLWAFEDNDVVIPMVVIEELDNLKNRQDIGTTARLVSRQLDKLREDNKDTTLSQGVKLHNGGTLRIVTLPHEYMNQMPLELRNSSVYDNVLIATAYVLHASSLETEEKQPCILVSKDVNVRIKCDAIGLTSQDYLKNRIAQDTTQLYRGVEVIEDESLADLIYDMYSNSKELYEVPEMILERGKIYSNEILVLKDGQQQSIILRVIENNQKLYLKRIRDNKNVMNLTPRNKEQNFSLSLLLDPDVQLVTLSGGAGSGKTCIALASGLEQLIGFGSHGIYDKLIISRPVQTVGKDLGYLPGTLQEKMDPWIAPIKDNLNFLFGYNKKENAKGKKLLTSKRDEDTSVEPYLSLLMQSGKIEIEAIPYIRGRSIPNSFLIIDEAQNLSLHELKTIITRAGEGTKIVLTGDLDQIDHPILDKWTSGLSYAIEKFKEESIAGHITLIKGERSTLASTAARIL